MTSLLPVLSVSGLLLLGFAVGKILPPSVLRQMLKPLSAVVLLLLFLMGAEFGGIFTDKALGADVVKSALLLSSLITAFTAALLYRKGGRAAPSGSFWPPFFGCLKAVAAFAAGVVAYRLLPHGTLEGVIGSTQVRVPADFFGGDGFGACPPGRPEPVRIPAAPVCSGGHGGGRFGFFPPDAVFVRPKPDAVGRLRLVFPVGADGGRTGVCRNGCDGFDDRFFREMFSIVFLYFFGKTQPAAAIGLSGAAAMDSALPFVKENCEPEYVKYAIVSGFILTLAAPVLISALTALLY